MMRKLMHKCLRYHFVHDARGAFGGDGLQARVVGIAQLLMVQSEQMQQRGLEIKK